MCTETHTYQRHEHARMLKRAQKAAATSLADPEGLASKRARK